MALEFEYKIITEAHHGKNRLVDPGAQSKFISWTAKWDGRIDNDPLVDSPESYCRKNPFCRIDDFELKKQLHKEIHFYPDPETDLKEIGEIVSFNPVTLALCEALKLSIENPKEFSKFSGWTDPYCYRQILIGCLEKLWD